MNFGKDNFAILSHLNNFVVLNDLKGLEDSINNLMLNKIDPVLRLCLEDYRHCLEVQKKLQSDQRSKKIIRVASFANKLASQPNIISKRARFSFEKEVKQERLIKARIRLKAAKELWKQKPEKHQKVK